MTAARAARRRRRRGGRHRSGRRRRPRRRRGGRRPARRRPGPGRRERVPGCGRRDLQRQRRHRGRRGRGRARRREAGRAHRRRGPVRRLAGQRRGDQPARRPTELEALLPDAGRRHDPEDGGLPARGPRRRAGGARRSTAGCRTRCCSRCSPTQASARWWCRHEPRRDATLQRSALGRRDDAPTTARRRSRSSTVGAAGSRDVDGREYLDLIAGIAVSSLGSRAPGDRRRGHASRSAASRTPPTWSSTRARRSRSPSGWSSCCGVAGAGCSSATTAPTANEAAIKIVAAGAATAAGRFVAAERSFHGRTLGALVAHRQGRRYREPFEPFGLESTSSRTATSTRCAAAVDDRHRRGLPRADARRGRA